MISFLEVPVFVCLLLLLIFFVQALWIGHGGMEAMGGKVQQKWRTSSEKDPLGSRRDLYIRVSG